MAGLRVIPVLLLQGDGLVKGERFRKHRYVGDPINAVKVFNDKEVDELVFLDINATRDGRTIDVDLVRKIADECYMPFAVGGGIRTEEDIRVLLNAGAEKVSVNTAAAADPDLIRRASRTFGAQSIVVAIDVKRRWTGAYSVVTQSGSRKTGLDPVTWAAEAARLGAGEILLTAIDRDGMRTGLDLALMRAVSDAVNVPVIGCGGAGSCEDLADAATAGASAVAAGSLFVFYGKHRAVLITYPEPDQLERIACAGADRRERN